MIENPWTYNGNPVTTETLEGFLAFVYIITDNENGKKYIGKKKCQFKKTTKVKIKTGVNAGLKRNKRSTVESDWETYYSSNRIISELAKENPTRYKREILYLCKTIGESSYLEAKEQFDRNVLLDENYYNEIINCRINGRALRAAYGTKK